MTAWTRRQTDLALALLACGCNNREIGARLIPTRTKNAVTGHLWRLGAKEREVEKLRLLAEQEQAVAAEQKRIADQAHQNIRARWPSSCVKCSNVAQRGYGDGLCSRCRSMPDRNRTGISPVMRPPGW